MGGRVIRRLQSEKVGYMEFITRCSEEMQIDTNTNSTASVLFPLPQYHVFRFPQIQDVYTLYRVHRMLVTEITHGALPVLPPPGQEVAELKRRLERYGPWQQKHGYMYLGEKWRELPADVEGGHPRGLARHLAGAVVSRLADARWKIRPSSTEIGVAT